MLSFMKQLVINGGNGGKIPVLLKEGIFIIMKEGKTDGKWRARDALIPGRKKVLATCVCVCCFDS